MICLPKKCGLMALAAAALFALYLDGEGQAQQPPKTTADAQKKLTDAQKKLADAQKKAEKEVLKKAESDVLVQAYVLISSANHDYGGYRRKAVDHVKSATNQVNPQVLKNDAINQTIKTFQNNNVAWANYLAWTGREFVDKNSISDYQLYQASALLKQVGVVTANNKQTNETKSIDAALKALDVALTVEVRKRVMKALKGMEARALREAYIILAASEGDFEGHRVKAMGHIAAATSTLNSKIALSMDSPEVLEAIELVRESNKEMVKSLAVSGDKKTNASPKKAVANYRVYEAGWIAENVYQLLVENLKHPALESLTDAGREIGEALRVK